MKKYISFGGAGDALIVALKLQQTSEAYEWTHVESHDISKIFYDIAETLQVKCNAKFTCNENYRQDLFSGAYSDFEYVSTSVDGWSEDLNRYTLSLATPFCDHLIERKRLTEKKYDYCIQVAAGARDNSRHWRFNPIILASLLRKKGASVALVGAAKLFEDAQDQNNFVNKVSLKETFDIILSSKMFIGLSGLLPFFAIACKIPTIHFEIDERHNKRYLHKDSFECVKNIKYGTISEIRKYVEI